MYSNNALNRWNSTPIENELRGRKKKETNKMGGTLLFPDDRFRLHGRWTSFGVDCLDP
jgi:hypothetical protein